MGNYGSFSCYVVFLELLEISSAKDELYTTALNIYLEMIKTLFMHKTDSIVKFLLYRNKQTKLISFTF